MATHQPIRAQDHLSLRIDRHLHLAHGRWVHLSWSRRQFERFVGNRGVPVDLYVHLRFDRWTSDLYVSFDDRADGRCHRTRSTLIAPPPQDRGTRP